MEGSFRGYYRLAEDQFEGIWAEGTVTFDANVLLNLYKLTAAARARFFDILEKLGPNHVWLADYAVLEFHRHRLEKIDEQLNAYRSVQAALNQASSILQSQSESLSKHPHLDIKAIRHALGERIETGRQLLKQAQTRHEDMRRDDPVLADLWRRLRIRTPGLRTAIYPPL